jgi:hypothetical protein
MMYMSNHFDVHILIVATRIHTIELVIPVIDKIV